MPLVPGYTVPAMEWIYSQSRPVVEKQSEQKKKATIHESEVHGFCDGALLWTTRKMTSKNDLASYDPLHGAFLRVFLYLLGDRDDDWRLVERINYINLWWQRQGTHFLDALVDEFITDPECSSMFDVRPASVESVVRIAGNKISRGVT